MTIFLPIIPLSLLGEIYHDRTVLTPLGQMATWLMHISAFITGVSLAGFAISTRSHGNATFLITARQISHTHLSIATSFFYFCHRLSNTSPFRFHRPGQYAHKSCSADGCEKKQSINYSRCFVTHIVFNKTQMKCMCVCLILYILNAAVEEVMHCMSYCEVKVVFLD